MFVLIKGQSVAMCLVFVVKCLSCNLCRVRFQLVTSEVIRYHSVLQSLLLMAEAVMIMSQGNIIASNLSRQGRVRLHWILQASAAAFIFAGFLVIVINKNLHSKNHFKSWHSVIGLVFLVCVGITSSGGVVTLYSLRLKQYIKPAKMKLFHNLVGVLTFVIGVASVIFGIYTHWFIKHAGLSAQIVCTVFVVLGGIFTLGSAVKSAYARFKALKQSV